MLTNVTYWSILRSGMGEVCHLPKGLPTVPPGGTQKGVNVMARHGTKDPGCLLDAVDTELFGDWADEIATLVDTITPLDRDTLIHLGCAHAEVFEAHPEQLIHGMIALALASVVAARDTRGGPGYE